MSVFRGDSDTGEVTEPEEGREVGGTSEIPGGQGTSATGEDKAGSAAADGITASAMRRALARARDGKALDRDEATILLHARGENLQTLLSYAGRTRDAGLTAANRPG